MLFFLAGERGQQESKDIQFSFPCALPAPNESLTPKNQPRLLCHIVKSIPRFVCIQPGLKCSDLWILHVLGRYQAGTWRRPSQPQVKQEAKESFTKTDAEMVDAGRNL